MGRKRRRIFGALPLQGRRPSRRKVPSRALTAEYDVLPIIRTVIDVEARYRAQVAAQKRDAKLAKLLR